MGAEAVAVDLDNTTVHDASFHLPSRIRQWVKNMQENGIRVIIVSNTVTFRAWFLSKRMGGVPYVAFAKKPDIASLERAAEKLQLHPSRIAMIGDQLFTDILVANRIGAISVKVDPIGKDIFMPKRYRRVREQEKEYLKNYHRVVVQPAP